MTHQCHRTPLPFRSLRQALELVGLSTDVLPLWRSSLNQRALSSVYTQSSVRDGRATAFLLPGNSEQEGGSRSETGIESILRLLWLLPSLCLRNQEYQVQRAAEPGTATLTFTNQPREQWSDRVHKPVSCTPPYFAGVRLPWVSGPALGLSPGPTAPAHTRAVSGLMPTTTASFSLCRLSACTLPPEPCNPTRLGALSVPFRALHPDGSPGPLNSTKSSQPAAPATPAPV